MQTARTTSVNPAVIAVLTDQVREMSRPCERIRMIRLRSTGDDSAPTAGTIRRVAGKTLAAFASAAA